MQVRTFVGRSRELAELSAELAAARSGGPVQDQPRPREGGEAVPQEVEGPAFRGELPGASEEGGAFRGPRRRAPGPPGGARRGPPGAPRVVLVQGPAGIGKTTLVERFLA